MVWRLTRPARSLAGRIVIAGLRARHRGLGVVAPTAAHRARAARPSPCWRPSVVSTRVGCCRCSGSGSTSTGRSRSGSSPSAACGSASGPTARTARSSSAACCGPGLARCWGAQPARAGAAHLPGPAARTHGRAPRGHRVAVAVVLVRLDPALPGAGDDRHPGPRPPALLPGRHPAGGVHRRGAARRAQRGGGQHRPRSGDGSGPGRPRVASEEIAAAPSTRSPHWQSPWWGCCW